MLPKKRKLDLAKYGLAQQQQQQQQQEQQQQRQQQQHQQQLPQDARASEENGRYLARSAPATAQGLNSVLSPSPPPPIVNLAAIALIEIGGF
jgi:hypothetical protein